MGVRTSSGLAATLAGLVIYLLNMYLFHGHIPVAISAVLVSALTGVLGTAISHISLMKLPPGFRVVRQVPATPGKTLVTRQEGQADLPLQGPYGIPQSIRDHEPPPGGTAA